MNIEKPITENQKQIANIIYKFLYHQRRFVTKQELCAELGWEYNSTNDRKIRDTINIIKKRKPIVATPDRKGYFAPICAVDFVTFFHTKRVKGFNMEALTKEAIRPFNWLKNLLGEKQ